MEDMVALTIKNTRKNQIQKITIGTNGFFITLNKFIVYCTPLLDKVYLADSEPHYNSP